MKKYLALLLSSAMVFSIAAASMAAATVKGDFRYDMYMDESNGNNQSYPISDLRVNVSGNISEKVAATGVFQMQHSGKGGLTTDGKNNFATATSFDMNEYYVTYTESWGGIKAGYYEYKFTPSRVLLKTAYDKHVWDKTDVMIATTVNLPVEGLSADVLYQPYAQKTGDDGAYGLSVAYNKENWGAKVTYADFKADKNLMALDVYYMINQDMKVFVNGADYDNGTGYNAWGIDGFDPVLGFSWNKIAGTNLFGAVEYAIESRNPDDATKEFNEYAVNVKYKFNDGVGLEIEHTVPGKDQTRDIVRLRYQF